MNMISYLYLRSYWVKVYRTFFA